MDKNKPDQMEMLKEMMEEAFLLAYHPYFCRLKFKVPSLNEYLEEVANSDEGIDTQKFFVEGIKRSLTPLLFQLMVEKIARFIEENKYDNNKVLPALWILELLKQGLQPWEIPFFYAIFARQVMESPFSTNKRIWKHIKNFVPRKIEEPEGGILVKGEEEKREETPPGYKRDEKTGLLIPEYQSESGRNKKIIT